MPRAQETRSRIIETALNALPKHGYGGLTVGFLAAEAGMSKSGLFARFGGQAALQKAVIDAAAEKFKQHVITPAREEAGALRRLERLAENWVTWLTADGLGRPCPLMQAAIEAPALTPEAMTYAREIRAQYPAYVARLAALARLEGGFATSLDADQFAFEFDGVGLSAGAAALTQPADIVRSRADAAFSDLLKRAQP